MNNLFDTCKGDWVHYDTKGEPCPGSEILKQTVIASKILKKTQNIMLFISVRNIDVLMQTVDQSGIVCLMNSTTALEAQVK